MLEGARRTCTLHCPVMWGLRSEQCTRQVQACSALFFLEQIMTSREERADRDSRFLRSIGCHTALFACYPYLSIALPFHNEGFCQAPEAMFGQQRSGERA